MFGIIPESRSPCTGFRTRTDFILYTGTSGKQTEAEDRGRLLSVLSIDLTKSYRTEELVSEESWQWAQANYPGQWEFSFGVLNGWSFDPPPPSSDVLPHSYPQMGRYPNPGMACRSNRKNESFAWVSQFPRRPSLYVQY